MTKMLSLGLMSGSSMDGVEVTLQETDGENHIVEIDNFSLPFEAQTKKLLKAAERAVKLTEGNLAEAEYLYWQALSDYLSNELKVKNLKKELKELENYFKQQTPYAKLSLANIIQHSTDLHIKAVEKLLAKINYSADEMDVIGYHGQTLYHSPEQKISIQVGDAKRMADELGITVVNDFRRRDIQQGGQGAPFAPIYHWALAKRDNKIPIVVLNCGGIANMTIIPNHYLQDLIAFDTGPGNGLIDALVRERTHGKYFMDKDGQYGLKGTVQTEFFEFLLEKSIIKNGEKYFFCKPPKSLDIRDMLLIPELNDLSLEDAAATLEAFSAKTIVDSLELLDLPLSAIPRDWILAGGGWHNPVIKNALTDRLQKKLGKVNIKLADQIGWNSQFLEAQIFSYFAVRSLKNLPLSLPKTTGVAKPLSGGAIHNPVLKKSELPSCKL